MRLTIQRKSAFTLLEIMLVVMIIAILAGSAIYMMSGNLLVTEDIRVKGDIQSIDTQLKLYQSLNGFLPTTEQGLQALVSRPDSDPKPTEWRQFMKQVPVDPWHMPYVYENPGKHNQNGYDIYSCGPDRKPGTDDDIGNWASTGK